MDEKSEKSNLFILNSICTDYDYNVTISSNDNSIKKILLNTQNSNFELKSLVDYSLNRINDQREQTVLVTKNRNNDQSNLNSNLICSSSDFYGNSSFENLDASSNFDKSFVNESLREPTNLLYSLSSSNYSNTDLSSSKSPTETKAITSTIISPQHIASVDCTVSTIENNVNSKTNLEQKEETLKTDQTNHKRGHKLNHHNNRPTLCTSNQRYYLSSQASRESHNEKERKRRSRMKKSCEMFRKLVPGIADKADKASVLESTVQYLIHLQKCLNLKTKSK